jgi:hypothetical protein
VEIDELRTHVEAFLRESVEEDYRNRAGLQTESRLAAVYERHARLADRDLLPAARARRAEATGAEERAGWEHLEEFLAVHHLEHAARDVMGRLHALEAGAALDMQEESVPLRAADVRLRNEENRARRDAIEAARCRALEGLLPHHAELWDRLHGLAQELGHPSYADLCAQISGVALKDLAAEAEALLRETEDAYEEHLRWYARRHLGAPFRELKRHDLLRLFRAPQWDTAFAPSRMLSACRAAPEKMGVDPAAEGHIQMDLEARPAKSSRAFVAAVEIPDRVILVTRPGGGPDDYRSFLHELGHALHYGYTDRRLPVEFRRLGDAAVSETWAFLMDGLLGERGWLRRFLGTDHPEDFLRLNATHKLFLLRRYAAKLQYELALHGGGGARGRADLYRELLGRAARAEFPRAMYLSDVDLHFYAARYWRAWKFEAQLREFLVERFDEEWYRNDRTGPFLIGLWRQGQRHRVEALAAQLGLADEGLAPLLRNLLAPLG